MGNYFDQNKTEESAFNFGVLYLTDLNDLVRRVSFYLQLQLYPDAHRTLAILFDMISPFLKKKDEQEDIIKKLNEIQNALCTHYFKTKSNNRFSPIISQTEKRIRETYRIILDKMKTYKLLIPLASDPSRALLG